MSRILVTGTSGFIGQAVAAALAKTHHVIGLSRKPTEIAGVTSIVGDFADPAELHKLDAHPDIDVYLTA